MVRTIIGVDCATQPKKTGLAVARFERDCWHLMEAFCCATKRPVDSITDWVLGTDGDVLICMDAPLGWPLALGEHLLSHSAGAPIDALPDRLFRRETDRCMAERVKRPLDVGADRIARTAHTALWTLGEVADKIGRPVPLAWSHKDNPPVSVIEVYPAATLLRHGAPITGYKAAGGLQQRTLVADHLNKAFSVPPGLGLEENCDVLDAAVCVLAGIDFLSGACATPADWGVPDDIAGKEGWIWVRA